MAILWGPKRIKAAEAEIRLLKKMVTGRDRTIEEGDYLIVKLERRIKLLLKKIDVLEDEGRIQAVKRDHQTVVDQMALVIRDQDRRIREKNAIIVDLIH